MHVALFEPMLIQCIFTFMDIRSIQIEITCSEKGSDTAMKPLQIYYRQIPLMKGLIYNGFTIYAILNASKNHPFIIFKIPLIRAWKKDDKWNTLDKRRLRVFKILEEQSHVDFISVKQVSLSHLNAQQDRFLILINSMGNYIMQCYLLRNSLHRIDLRIKTRVTKFLIIY